MGKLRKLDRQSLYDKKYTLIISLILLTIVALAVFQNVSAQEKPDLEEILKGFGDAEKSSEELQDVLEGFEKEEATVEELEEVSEDGILEGFDDEIKESKRNGTEKARLPNWLSVDGYFKISSVYSYLSHDSVGADTNWHGLTRLRSELKLELDADVSKNWQARVSGHAFYDVAYTVNGRENYTDDVLNNYEKELEFDEVYLQGNLTKDLDLKTGRQIVVWGRSDNIRIADVLNPLDLRWPGLVDIEKLRLPVTMTKFDYYINDWSLSGIVFHEVRYNKNPEFGSDFFSGTQPLPGKKSPDEELAIDSKQFAASLNGIFRGWDVSFYFADIYAQDAYISPKSSSPVPQFELKHARTKMLGGAFNLALGNWLFKAEAAFFDGFEFTNTPDRNYCRLDALIGTEYTGISDSTITLEMANRHYFDFDERVEDSPDFQKKDLFEWALRVTKPYWNDTLNLTFFTTIFGLTGEDGGFQRFTAVYDLTDSIELTVGTVFYQSGDLRRTMGIGDNDRVYFNVQYNF